MGDMGIRYSTSTVSDDQHKPVMAALILGTFLIKRGEADPVLLHAVRQRPLGHELEAWRHQQPDFFSQRPGQDLGRGGGRGGDTAERERGQGRGLVGRCGALQRRRDHAVGVGIHQRRWWRFGRLGQAAVEGGDNMGDGECEVGAGGLVGER